MSLNQIDKKEILKLFIDALESDLHQLEASIQAAKDEATHEESKPENEYDTRALETGYLVKAQSKRILDAKEVIGTFKYITLKNFSEKDGIQATALIRIDNQGREQILFYMPSGGGRTLTFKSLKIQIITPSSPLGEALLGLKVGDVAIVEQGNDVKEFEILGIA